MKNNKNKISFKKRFVTLIEMMIVMFLIALITGVVAYNYRGTLDEGKAFKTKHAIDKIEQAISLAVADNPSADLSNWQEMVRASPFISNPESLMKDGWGGEYVVGFDPDTNRIVIRSAKYDAYLEKTKGSMFQKE